MTDINWTTTIDISEKDWLYIEALRQIAEELHELNQNFPIRKQQEVANE